MEEKIIKTEYSEVMQKSFIDYAMSVIVARALPDVRDGLKPVQRRTLYDMHELGIRYDRPYRKSARIVGDTMGKYHPHGDSSIYDALVVMSQDFKKGLPMIDGHGNFGNIEGDGAAAMRYTEARLEQVTQEAFLADLDKDVVDFIPNFDETEKEPSVLPVKFPNLLVNGSEGIAVGMATSTPPHNLSEVIDATKAYMNNEDITTKELMRYIQGPDFPTGGIVTNKDDLLSIYETGAGKIKIRGKVDVEKGKGGKVNVVISEIPYTMIGSYIGKFLSDVASLAETKKTQDISDISNQSSKEGIRIVIELRKDADVDNFINMLYKKTRLEDTFGVNMLAIVDGRPETLGLKEIIKASVDFQYETTTRKYENLLAKENSKREIQEGLIKACNVIDLIIEILRGSKDRAMAKACLVEGKTDGIRFKSKESGIMAQQLRFSENQANAILEMRLYRLIGLEIEALQAEYDQTMKNIASYEDILKAMASDPTSVAEFVSSPVKLQTVPVYPVEHYGSAASPFYTILAIWVGALFLVAIIHVGVKPIDPGDHYKEYERYFGRYLLFFLLAQIQAAIIVAGDLWLLKVNIVEPALFFLAASFTATAFSLLIYSLTLAFGDVGKAVCVIVMVLQIAGSSGTFPIELLPDTYQKIYIFFPFPYAITAMREALAGMYGTAYVEALAKLILFMLEGLLIGLVIRIPFVKLNHFVEERMEDTELM